MRVVDDVADESVVNAEVVFETSGLHRAYWKNLLIDSRKPFFFRPASESCIIFFVRSISSGVGVYCCGTPGVVVSLGDVCSCGGIILYCE